MRINRSSDENQGKLKKIFLYVKSFFPFFLSHHPECETFKEHTLKCGKIKLCVGCFIGYTTAIIAILIIKVFNLREFFSSKLFFILSIVLLGTFLLSPLNLTKNKKIKIIQKFIMGLGAALLFSWIMERPYSKGINTRTAFIVINILLIILNFYHVYGILSSCYKCKTPFNWGICPGFSTIRCRMKLNDLDNFLLKFENFSNRLFERKEKKNKSSIIK